MKRGFRGTLMRHFLTSGAVTALAFRMLEMATTGALIALAGGSL